MVFLMCSVWFHCVFSDIERKLQSKPRVMMVGLFNESCFWYVPLFCVVCRLDLLLTYEIIRITKLNIYLPSNGLDLTFFIRWALVAFTQNEGAQTDNLEYTINQPAMQKMFSHFSSFLTKLRSTDVIGQRKDHWFVIDFSFSSRDQ